MRTVAPLFSSDGTDSRPIEANVMAQEVSECDGKPILRNSKVLADQGEKLGRMLLIFFDTQLSNASSEIPLAGTLVSMLSIGIFLLNQLKLVKSQTCTRTFQSA